MWRCRGCDYLCGNQFSGAPRIDATRLYGDPRLYGTEEAWHEFVEELLPSGLVRLAPEQRETVRIFFVKKADGQLRMEIDCRGDNEACLPPPKTELGSVTSMRGLSRPAFVKINLAPSRDFRIVFNFHFAVDSNA